jgi:hypothetical protein
MQMTREPLGSYYDRAVMFQAAPRFDEIMMSKLDHAAVLLWLGDRDWDEEALERVIARYIDRGTLHLTISGERAGDSFGVMMGAVSQLQGNFVTTLNVTSGLALAEGVEDFLKHAAPAEAQLRAWREYHIVLVGGDDAKRGAFDAAIGRCIGVRA